MAKFVFQYPDSIIKDLKYIYDNAEEIFGGMTRKGAEVARDAMIDGCPYEPLKSYAKLTRTYKTPTDGGINTKAVFSGYLPFSDPHREYFSRRGANGMIYRTSKGVPVDFLVNLYEYGRSSAPWPKHPFVRKAFNKKKIEKAMLDEQKRLSRGLLDEDWMGDIESDYMRDLAR